MPLTIEQIADETERVFQFMVSGGYRVECRQILEPNSFKGGFILMLAGPEGKVRVQYLDMEFSVSRAETELFGWSTHLGFGGNMFTREHLMEALPRIAETVRNHFGPSDAGQI